MNFSKEKKPKENNADDLEGEGDEGANANVHANPGVLQDQKQIGNMLNYFLRYASSKLFLVD